LRDFAGKVVYITGGSSGMGLAIGARLAGLGAHVAVMARDRGRLDAAAEQLRAARRSPQQRVAALACDVADAPAVTRAFDALAKEIGAPDLVVANAGFAYLDYLRNVTETHMRDMAATNLFGAYHTMRAAAALMKGRGGTIVAVSSVGGIVGYFGAAAYCATKFGVIGMAEAMRNELAPDGIRVAVLCPPNTDTPGFERENRTKPAETHAVEGTAGTYSPDQVAAALVRGLRRRGRFLIFCGFMSSLTSLAHRLAPGLVYSFMDGDVARARRKATKETTR
jgi:3-dehydrosphinganine reductase